MIEHERHPAHRTESQEWAHLEQASQDFADTISSGISAALDQGREIDDQTARTIAHVLGHAYGPESHLADFARMEPATYESLRDEYLALYNDEHATPRTKQMINWLGTYLVARENIGSGRRITNEYDAPDLGHLLVATPLVINGETYPVHIPGNCDSTAIDGLARTLTDLQLARDEGLQAFLTLPDVNAMSGDIMGSFNEAYIATFNTIEDAVDVLVEVDELKNEVDQFASERGLVIDSYSPDYEALTERVRDAFDIVEWKGRVYAFAR
ncbi:hypothetical protein GCM10027414_04990 [Humibacter ginsengiterrae]